MAGKRALLLEDEPFEVAGYPRVEAMPDGLGLRVGQQVAVLAEHFPDGGRYGTWYPVPHGQGLQMRMLPSQYLQIQTPDCDEPDEQVGGRWLVVDAETVERQHGPELLFHAHGMGVTRPYNEEADDACFGGDLSFGLIGHGSANKPASLVVFASVEMAAQIVAGIESSAEVNGYAESFAAALDQARSLTRDMAVQIGLKPQCEAIDDLTGRRCRLAAGHPDAGLLSTLTDGKITMAGHVWGEVADGTNSGPAASSG